jgi:putative ABC transport system permease protein
MMSALGSGNRAMFWRIVRRLLGANRGRLFVILLALAAGAAVTAALLNLQVDASRRLTNEFRAFGANLIVAPSQPAMPGANPATIQWREVSERLGDTRNSAMSWAPFLYFVADAQKVSSSPIPTRHQQTRIIAVGTSLGAPLDMLIPGWGRPPLAFLDESDAESVKNYCFLGMQAAGQLHVQAGDTLELFREGHSARLKIIGVISTGGDEDKQVFVELETNELLTGLHDQASLVKITYPGTPTQIEEFRAKLAASLPDFQVHPVTQFTEAQSRIYSRISGLLTATVVVVLVLTGLCVMAAMTNVAMERKNDVGLMKAIGGATRRVLRLFMVEAALLGLAGGVIGAAAGIFLSIWLGKQVFGVAAQPRLIVYPVAVALTVIVAILSAYPLRRLASIRPASVFRGEA